MVNLPVIFQVRSDYKPVTDRVQSPSQWIEFVAQVSKFSDSNIPETQTQLELLLESEAHPVNQAILFAGMGRCQIREGHFIDGARTLGYAHSLLSENNTDARAFVLLEMISFLSNIDQHEWALALLERIPHLTQSEYLLKVTQYYQIVQRSRIGELSIIDELKQSADYFDNIGEFSTLSYHHKNIGNIYRKFKDYSSAKTHYQTAISIAEKYDFAHIIPAVNHDVGMLNFHNGNFENALKILNDVQLYCGSFYTKCFTLANMGFLYYHKKIWNQAADHFQKSLNIATEHGVFHLLPGSAYYLAESYQKLNNFDLAKYFYEKGFNTAHELLQHGFKYSGDRMKAIRGYVQFLKIRQSQIDEVSNSDFFFAIDKTLKDIREIFQAAFFDFINLRSKSNRDAIQTMGIADKTYYLIRDRIQKNPDISKPESVLNFIRQQTSWKWKEINRKFERQLLIFLHQHYRSSKKQLAQKLGVSYPHILQITKDMNNNLMLKNQNPSIQL